LDTTLGVVKVPSRASEKTGNAQKDRLGVVPSKVAVWHPVPHQTER
jgi:hypothetical protein